MKQPILILGRLCVGTLFVCLGGCGDGGGAGGPAIAAADQISGSSMVAVQGRSAPARSELPTVCAGFNVAVYSTLMCARPYLAARSFLAISDIR